MKYAVNEAGVSALQNISTALMNSVADLFEKTSQLQTITSDNEDSLGPHKASLNQAIMEIYIGLKESTESISTLAASAKDIAEAYQEIIDNDYLSSTAESSAGTAAGTGGIGSTHVAGVVAPADRIKTCGREWTESLSKENKAAIHSYTGTAYSNMKEMEIDYLCIPSDRYEMNDETEGTFDDWKQSAKEYENDTSILLVNNSDYLQKARKYGHFTGYKN